MAGMDKCALWSERIEQWRSSGLSRRAWCERSGINPHTFDYWRRRQPALLPIAVAPTAPAVVVTPSRVDIVLPNGITLHVTLEADAAAVARWAHALQAC